jgi:hypothetical protein
MLATRAFGSQPLVGLQAQMHPVFVEESLADAWLSYLPKPITLQPLLAIAPRPVCGFRSAELHAAPASRDFESITCYRWAQILYLYPSHHKDATQCFVALGTNAKKL